MMTVDRALTLYTDQIASNNNFDINELIKQLAPDDVQEFLEAAEAVRVLHAFQQGNKFDHFFVELNKYKSDLYSYSTAVDFRGKNDDEVKDQVDRLFDEEFDDE